MEEKKYIPSEKENDIIKSLSGRLMHIVIGGANKKFLTRCLDADSQKIIIEFPFKAGPSEIPGGVNAEIEARFKDAVYIIPVTVKKRFNYAVNRVAHDAYMLYLAGKIKRLQRRKAYRLSLIVEAKFKRIDKNNEEGEGELKDISATGFALRTDISLAKGERILCSFAARADKKEYKIEMAGMVMDSIDKKNEKIKYRYLVKVILLNESDEVMNFIFNKQRELRLKGIL